MMASDALLPIHRIDKGFSVFIPEWELWQQHRIPWKVVGASGIRTGEWDGCWGVQKRGEIQNCDVPGRPCHGVSGRSYEPRASSGRVGLGGMGKISSGTQAVIRVIRAHKSISGISLECPTTSWSGFVRRTMLTWYVWYMDILDWGATRRRMSWQSYWPGGAGFHFIPLINR